MKTISLPLLAVLALVFVLWTSAPAQAYQPYYSGYTGQHPHSQAAAPYIGPFYPYPQVPLGVHRSSMEYDAEFWALVGR